MLTRTHRGKALGGSSVVNYMAWDRGSKEEYDAWSAVSDAGGWNWDSILPFLTKAEDVAPASVNPDPVVEYSASAAHVLNPGLPREEAVGVGGPIKVGLSLTCCLPLMPLSALLQREKYRRAPSLCQGLECARSAYQFEPSEFDWFDLSHSPSQ